MSDDTRARQARDDDRLLARTLAAITPPPHDPVGAQDHIDRLTKPPGSLGALEELALHLSTMYGDPPGPFDDVVVYVLAGDHGVAKRGVSAYPPEVTAQMCANFSTGGAAINVLSRAAGARVVVADLGVDADLSGLPNVLDRKVRRGTDDLAAGPAMRREEAVRGLAAGIDLVAGAEHAPDLVAIGEMGIGNTTAASAVTACLAKTEVSRAELVDRVIGPGTGIDAERLSRKRELVRAAVHRVQADDPVGVLAEVGGFEIAGMAGVALGAAAAGRAVLIDGFISTAAALVAASISPQARGYFIASHRSPEPGHTVALDTLGLEPLLDMRLRLGEGSGAALAIPLVRAAARIMREMATFESAGISGPDEAP